jgi:hypothetical protein
MAELLVVGKWVVGGNDAHANISLASVKQYTTWYGEIATFAIGLKGSVLAYPRRFPVKTHDIAVSRKVFSFWA